MIWLWIILLLLAGMLIKLLLNFYKFKKVRKLYNSYQNYLKYQNLDFSQNKQEIKTLFKKADLEDFLITHDEPVSQGRIVTHKVSGFEYLTKTRPDIINSIHEKFNEAIGVYRKRYKDSYNPIFWIEFLINFPEKILTYLGVPKNKVAFKTLNLLYWIITILAGLKQFGILKLMIGGSNF